MRFSFAHPVVVILPTLCKSLQQNDWEVHVPRQQILGICCVMPPRGGVCARLFLFRLTVQRAFEFCAWQIELLQSLFLSRRCWLAVCRHTLTKGAHVVQNCARFAIE